MRIGESILYHTMYAQSKQKIMKATTIALIIAVIFIAIMLMRRSASESMAGPSNELSHIYDTSINGKYVRTVDPLVLRPLVDSVIETVPIDPIAGLRGYQ